MKKSTRIMIGLLRTSALGVASSCLLAMTAAAQTNELRVSTEYVARYGIATDLNCSVQLKFGGVATQAVALSNLRVTRATDDTGLELANANPKDFLFSSTFRATRRGEWVESVRLKCPAQAAKMIRRLEGEVDLAFPTTANGGRFTIDSFTARPGEIIQDARLDEHGIKLIYHTLESFVAFQRAHPKKYLNSADLEVEKRCFSGIYGNPTNPPRKLVAIQIDDPNQKLLGFQFEQPDGTHPPFTPVSTSANFRCYRFETVPPNDLRLVALVAAPGVVRTERFSVTDVWLPWDRSPGSPYADPPELRADSKISAFRGRTVTNASLTMTFKGGPITNAHSIGTVTLRLAADENGNAVYLTDPPPPIPSAPQPRFRFSPVNPHAAPKEAWKSLYLRNISSVKNLAWLEGEVEVFHPSPTNGGFVVFPDLLRRKGRSLPLPGEGGMTTDLRFAGRVNFEQERAAVRRSSSGAVLSGGWVTNLTNAIRFDLWNPEGYIITLEFQEQAGKPIRPNGRVESDHVHIYSFPEPPRDDWSLVVYLAAPGAIHRHPFCAENVEMTLNPVAERELAQTGAGRGN